jgi:hypothetical protein
MFADGAALQYSEGPRAVDPADAGHVVQYPDHALFPRRHEAPHIDRHLRFVDGAILDADNAHDIAVVGDVVLGYIEVAHLADIHRGVENLIPLHVLGGLDPYDNRRHSRRGGGGGCRGRWRGWLHFLRAAEQ